MATSVRLTLSRGAAGGHFSLMAFLNEFEAVVGQLEQINMNQQTRN